MLTLLCCTCEEDTGGIDRVFDLVRYVAEDLSLLPEYRNVSVMIKCILFLHSHYIYSRCHGAIQFVLTNHMCIFRCRQHFQGTKSIPLKIKLWNVWPASSLFLGLRWRSKWSLMSGETSSTQCRTLQFYFTFDIVTKNAHAVNWINESFTESRRSTSRSYSKKPFQRRTACCRSASSCLTK